MYEKDITIKVSGKDKKEVAKKISKIYYLLSFLKNDSSSLITTLAFLFFSSLFLAYIFFWIYITTFWVYSKDFLWTTVTPTAYVYEKSDLSNSKWLILPVTKKTKITTCWIFYCLDENGKYIEKPIIQTFVILDF